MRINNLCRKIAISAAILALSSAPALALVPPDESYLPPNQASLAPQDLGQLRQSELGAAQAPMNAQQQAQNDSDTPQPMTIGNITYITGGVGDEDRTTLESVKRDYNLHVTNASKSGEFEDDIAISITDSKGTELLNAPVGPLFYAKLPAGRYTVQASSGGQIKKQSITIGRSKAANLHLSW